MSKDAGQATEIDKENGLKLLFVGACMIVGHNVPPTKAVPFLVRRTLSKESHFKPKIDAYHKCYKSEDLSFAIKRFTLDENKFDAVIIQFLTIAVLPFRDVLMGVYDNTGSSGPESYITLKSIIRSKWYTSVRKFIPDNWITFFQYNILRMRPDPFYINNLRKCIELIQEQSKNTKIFLMTPIAPTGRRLRPLKKRFQNIRDSILKLANECGVGVIDIYTTLNQYEPEIVYQKDGYHPSARGQEIISEAIARTLLSSLR